MKRFTYKSFKAMVNDHWSVVSEQWTVLFFLISISTSAQTITRAEYFYDADPGVGNATALSITPGATINQTYNLSTSSLSTGFHTFNARVKDNTGKWSLFTARTFYVIPNPFSTLPGVNITKAEYFYDADPGVGNGSNIPVTVNPSLNITINTPTTPLTAGFHTMNVRVRDDQGRWSLFTTRTFYLMPASALPSNLVKLEYYVDTDPGIGQATSVNVPVAPTVDQLFTLNLPLLTPGSYTLNVRAKDSNGFWSDRVAAPFTIVTCTGPPAPTAADVSRCGAGSVTLSANGATGAQEYRWYADAVTGTILFTGSSFVTPVLSVGTTYYVSIFDPATCESGRTAVTITITPGPCAAPPVISPVPLTTQIEGQVTLDLVPLISTSGTLDLSSLQLVSQPSSGAVATITNGVLFLDYEGLQFSGTDRFTLRACDTNGTCSEQEFEVEVVGDIIIYNAVSPNGDGKNEFFNIQYIEILPETRSNKVTIYNRWGDVVYEASDYDNNSNVFTGLNTNGKELPSGTYFYKIEYSTGRESKTGFLSLKR